MSRPNTTQRSWDNYVGDKPIKSWEKQGFYQSRKNNEEDIPEGYELDPVTGGLRKKRKSDADEGTKESQWERLQKNSLGKRAAEKNKQESQWKKLQRESALRRGMSQLKNAKLLEEDYDEDSFVS